MDGMLMTKTGRRSKPLLLPPLFLEQTRRLPPPPLRNHQPVSLQRPRLRGKLSQQQPATGPPQIT